MDLRLHIHERRRDGQANLYFRLDRSNTRGATWGPVALHLEPSAYFQGFIRDLEALAVRDDRTIAEKRLEAKGTHLFKTLLPEQLRKILWQLRDEVRTIQVISEEPWIPWELLKLQGQGSEQRVAGPFFGEAFAITRWLRGNDAPQVLPLRRLALVAPEDAALPHASTERDFILSLANAQRLVQRIPARFLSVTTAMAAGQFDGWHFIGHGGARGVDPSRWGIRLENYEQLRPEDLNADAGNLGATRPLVFLNGCHTGRTAHSLTGIGGWAKQFLEAGAGAFIGAQWTVPDRPAMAFAETFYRDYLNGEAIGEATRKARLEVRRRFPGDPSWLAYSTFAHPLAACQVLPKKYANRAPLATASLAMLLLGTLLTLERAPRHDLPISSEPPSKAVASSVASGSPTAPPASPPESPGVPAGTPESPPPHEDAGAMDGELTERANLESENQQSPEPPTGASVSPKGSNNSQVSRNDSEHDQLFQQAGQARHAGRTQEAIGLLKKALQLQPKDERTLYSLSLLLEIEERYAEAENYLRQLVRRFPDNDKYRFDLYEVQMAPRLSDVIRYHENQQYDLALVPAQKIRDINPAAPMGSALLGLSHVLRNWNEEDREDAIFYLREAITLHQGLLAENPFRLDNEMLANLHNGLGVTYLRRDDHAKAQAHFLETLRHDPDNLDAQHNLKLAIEKELGTQDDSIRWVSIAELLGIE